MKVSQVNTGELQARSELCFAFRPPRRSFGSTGGTDAKSKRTCRQDYGIIHKVSLLTVGEGLVTYGASYEPRLSRLCSSFPARDRRHGTTFDNRPPINRKSEFRLRKNGTRR